MPVELSIPTIIKIGQLSQTLASVDNEKNTYFKGSVLDIMLPKKISWVWKPLALRYAANPNDVTLRQIAEWLLQLCGPYALQAGNIINNISTGTLPVLTGPNSATVSVGQTATFSVSVTGTGPFTYQWFVNGVAIAGANASSYPVTNAQLSQTGTLYSVKVTNAVGSVTSNTATLTVIASLVGFWYAGNVDYSAQLLAGNDVVPYNGTFSIVNGQPLVVPFPAGQVLYVAVKYPVSQSVKTRYANPSGGLDQGVVPGLALGINTFGGNNYIFSNTGAPFGINNQTGQCTFS